jgi:hypothetical protein
MRKSLAVALCALAGLVMTTAPEAQAQKSKTKEAAAPAAKAWTDCSKVEPAKRDVCIRSLPVVRGPVPIAGAAAAAAPAAAAKAAPAKDAKKDAKAAPAAAAGAIPCAGVEAAKRDACLSKAAAVKGPGWAAFAAKPLPPIKKK